MPGGRPRTSYELRRLEGGLGKSRPLERDRPAPGDALEVPDQLTAEELAAWHAHANRIQALGLETSVDSGAVEALVRSFCRARKAERAIAEHGLTQNVGGVIRQRPEVTIAAQSWNAYLQVCEKFGLSPTARTRVGGDVRALGCVADVPEHLKDVGGDDVA